MIRLFIWTLLSLSFTFGLSGGTTQELVLDNTLNFAKRHQQFHNLHFKQNEGEFVRLIKEGQSPKIAFIGCSDSRVIPEFILNAKKGEIFVIRTAGNFVPPFSPQTIEGVSATLQFAVEALKIPHIVVCGHSHCGAVRGMFQDLNPEQLGLVKGWIKNGLEAKELTLKATSPSTPQEEIYKTAEEINVLVQLEHMLTFDFIRKALEENRIQLHGWYFDIEEGRLLYYDSEKNRFLPLTPESVKSTDAI